MLHLMPEQAQLLIVLIAFTLAVVGIDVLISCFIARELVRQGRVQPPTPPRDAGDVRTARLHARLDDAICRPWSMSVQPRDRVGRNDVGRA